MPDSLGNYTSRPGVPDPGSFDYWDAFNENAKKAASYRSALEKAGFAMSNPVHNIAYMPMGHDEILARQLFEQVLPPLAERFPLTAREIGIVMGTQMEPWGEAVFSNPRQIHLDEDLFFRESAPRKNANFMREVANNFHPLPVNPIRNIAGHEFGHHVFDRLLNPYIFEYDPSGKVSDAVENPVAEKASSLNADLQRLIHKVEGEYLIGPMPYEERTERARLHGFPSTYATTNPHEAFAEAFTKLHPDVSPPNLDESDYKRRVREIVEVNARRNVPGMSGLSPVEERVSQFLDDVDASGVGAARLGLVGQLAAGMALPLIGQKIKNDNKALGNILTGAGIGVGIGGTPGLLIGGGLGAAAPLLNKTPFGSILSRLGLG